MFCTLLAIFAVAVFASGFDTASRIAQMKQMGRKFVIGKNEQSGTYIICAETVEIKNDDMVQAQEQAKMQARVSIAEFMSVNVEASVRNGEVSKTAVDDNGESFNSEEFRESCSKKSTRQLQKGLTVCSTEKQGNKLIVYCFLSEKIIDASAQLEQSMKKLGPDTVQVSGCAYIGHGISEMQAEKNAIREAQREAIAQVLGVSMVSQSYRQSVSKNTVDAEGEEDFSCDDTFKSKVFAAAAGFVESCRVIDKQQSGATITVTIVAKVAKDKLMDDYRSYLESMGNPGFCLRANNRDMLDLYSGFFAGLGLRMVDNLYDATYVIDVSSKFYNGGNGIRAAVRVTAWDKNSREVIFSQENDPSEFSAASDSQDDKNELCRQILKKMRPLMHKKLNTFIGRANADGRKVQVVLIRYDSGYRHVLGIVQKALQMVPGVANVKQYVSGRTVTYELNFKGDTEDLANFLEKHLETDIAEETDRPVRSKVANTRVEFKFE